jgi:hypothetical protein
MKFFNNSLLFNINRKHIQSRKIKSKSKSKSKSKTKTKKQNTKKQNTKKQNAKKQRGGFIKTEEITKSGSKNRAFETIVGNDKIRYVIPQTLLLKEVNQIRIPSFIVNVNNKNYKTSIQTPNGKFIDYLVDINGIIYGIMRLYGFFNFNAGAFAHFTNDDLFIKLDPSVLHFEYVKSSSSNHCINDVNIILDIQNFISIKDNYFWKDNDTTVIQLKPNTFKTVNSGEVYDILVRFRSIEHIKNNIKKEMPIKAFDLMVHLLTA